MSEYKDKIRDELDDTRQKLKLDRENIRNKYGNNKVTHDLKCAIMSMDFVCTHITASHLKDNDAEVERLTAEANKTEIEIRESLDRLRELVEMAKKIAQVGKAMADIVAKAM